MNPRVHLPRWRNKTMPNWNQTLIQCANSVRICAFLPNLFCSVCLLLEIPVIGTGEGQESQEGGGVEGIGQGQGKGQGQGSGFTLSVDIRIVWKMFLQGKEKSRPPVYTTSNGKTCIFPFRVKVAFLSSYLKKSWLKMCLSRKMAFCTTNAPLKDYQVDQKDLNVPSKLMLIRWLQKWLYVTTVCLYQRQSDLTLFQF